MMDNLDMPEEGEGVPFFYQQEKKKAITSRKTETLSEKVYFWYYEIKFTFFLIRHVTILRTYLILYKNR